MKKIVFMVDDDPELLDVFKDLLSSESVDIFTFENHIDALAEIKNKNPNVLFLDAQLSGVSGLDVVHQFDPSLKKYLCSGSFFKATPKGFNGVLSKPFLIEDFQKVIEAS